VRGVGCGEGGTVILSIDVDGLYGTAGPPLQVVMFADEARLTAQLIREAAGRRSAERPAPALPAEADDDAEAEVLEAGVVALEGWGRAICRHVRGFLGFRSSDGAADPRAPP
jgi:hypothetical protein